MKQKKKTQKNRERTMWGIVDFPVILRKKICAVAECKNITVSALMEEICCKYVNKKETKEILTKDYVET